MPSVNGEDFQNSLDESADPPQAAEGESMEATEIDPELTAGPRAERPNFLTATRFVDFDLPPEILEGLDSAGFEYCTPIQAQAIPVAMEGLDIAGQAQTGTGKTTAFLVPLLNRLMKNKPMEPGLPRAIIVTPTRELALQIYEDAQVLAKSTDLKQVLVIGGMEYKEQADVLSNAPEIVICTPGRIIDYLKQGIFKTRAIEVAVVDEADRLLDMGFIKDLKYLLGKLPSFTQRQTMLFSATLDDRVLELTYQFMNPPQYITAEPDKSTKVSIQQELFHIGRDEKLSLLLGLLGREEHRRVIIFSNTKSGVEWLAKKLTMNGFQAEGITGDLPQPKRLKLMESFKENRLQILVATDVASRGIHVDDVSHVYNYDLPQDAENYVHRIGRTARAGNTGKAVSFGCEDYVFHLEAIENLLGEKIPVVWAEAEWFQRDQGGEVRLKDRRGDRDRRKGGGDRDRDRRGGGRGDTPRPPLSRGPAKSQRPGGIFGLAPRLSSGNGLDSARQSLSWSIEEAPIIDAEILEITTFETTVEAAPEGSEKEGGRRRKRRRGRRGRDGEGARGPVANGSEVMAEGGQGAGDDSQERPAAPREPQVRSDQTDGPAEKPARGGRGRKPAERAKARVAESLADIAASAVEAPSSAAPSPGEEVEKPKGRGGRKKAEAPAAPQAEPDRYPKKRVSGPVPAPKAVVEEPVAEGTEPIETAKAAKPPRAKAAVKPKAAEAAPGEEKPKRGRKKAAETEGAEPAKAPAKPAARKTAAAAKGAAKAEGLKETEAPAKKPRKTAAAKEEAAKPARGAAKKTASVKEAIVAAVKDTIKGTAKTGPAVRKTAPAEKATAAKKIAVPKAPKKAEAATEPKGAKPAAKAADKAAPKATVKKSATKTAADKPAAPARKTAKKAAEAEGETPAKKAPARKAAKKAASSDEA